MGFEFISALVGVIALVVTIAVFFVRMERSINSVVQALDRLESSSTKEHVDMLQALSQLRDQMNREHREFLEMSRRIAEPLIQINTKLDTHLDESRQAFRTGTV